MSVAKTQSTQYVISTPESMDQEPKAMTNCNHHVTQPCRKPDVISLLWEPDVPPDLNSHKKRRSTPVLFTDSNVDFSTGI